jgi:hypothetical protein
MLWVGVVGRCVMGRYVCWVGVLWVVVDVLC